MLKGSSGEVLYLKKLYIFGREIHIIASSFYPNLTVVSNYSLLGYVFFSFSMSPRFFLGIYVQQRLSFCLFIHTLFNILSFGFDCLVAI